MEQNINLIPINEIKRDILNFLKYNLGKIFQTKISVLERVSISKSFYNPKRNQYNAHEILKFLISEFDVMSSGDIFLGIFNKDIYTPSFNFVFGLATRYPKACLISFSRLDPSFYKCKETDKDHQKLFNQRILTEAVHEIGHTMGLDHCENPKCVMHFSNTLEETDVKGYEFCKKCRKLIES